MPPPTPPTMDPEIETLLVVGYLHCALPFKEVSRALGHRPHTTTPYYHREHLAAAYARLQRSRSNPTYSIWGPHWARHKGRDRIDQRQIDKKKALIHEGLRRTRFAEKLAALRTEEQARRKAAWRALQGYRSEGDWRLRDERELGWNALAERRR